MGSSNEIDFAFDQLLSRLDNVMRGSTIRYENAQLESFFDEWALPEAVKEDAVERKRRFCQMVHAISDRMSAPAIDLSEAAELFAFALTTTTETEPKARL